ncbi:hypothetical protein PT286_03560 [Neisseriaceae bacterium ESL0693]|nr:hypothetical protein [Neisseriaceae bacterium ESL0693]
MSVSHTINTSFYGGQWQGGLMPTGSLCQSFNPAICLPSSLFESNVRVF